MSTSASKTLPSSRVVGSLSTRSRLLPGRATVSTRVTTEATRARDLRRKTEGCTRLGGRCRGLDGGKHAYMHGWLMWLVISDLGWEVGGFWLQRMEYSVLGHEKKGRERAGVFFDVTTVSEDGRIERSLADASTRRSAVYLIIETLNQRQPLIQNSRISPPILLLSERMNGK